MSSLFNIQTMQRRVFNTWFAGMELHERLHTITESPRYKSCSRVAYWAGAWGRELHTLASLPYSLTLRFHSRSPLAPDVRSFARYWTAHWKVQTVLKSISYLIFKEVLTPRYTYEPWVKGLKRGLAEPFPSDFACLRGLFVFYIWRGYVENKDPGQSHW